MCCPLPKVTPRSPRSLGAQRGFDPGQGASNPAFLAAAEPRGLAAGPGLGGVPAQFPQRKQMAGKRRGNSGSPGGELRRLGPSEFPVLGWAPALSASEGVTNAGRSPRLWGMFVWRESGERGFRGGCRERGAEGEPAVLGDKRPRLTSARSLRTSSGPWRRLI